MNINFNINPKTLDKLINTLDRIADMYARVHATALRDELPVTGKAKVFYQNDKTLYEVELKKKIEKAVLEGTGL